MIGTVPANLPAAPTLKHPDQEEDAEGGALVMVLEDAPWDFRTRASNKRLRARCGRRTGVRRADSAHGSHAGGYEQYTHDGEDHSDTREPHLLASRYSGPALSAADATDTQPLCKSGESDPRCAPLRIPKTETPDVKLSELLVAERRDDAVQDQLLLRDRRVASIANLAVGRITRESCHARRMAEADC